MLGRGSDNFGAIIDEILANGSSKKLGIAVTIETLCKGTSGGPKETECQKDAIQGQSLKSKHPIVPSAPVHQNEGISKATNGKTVAKSNIHTNSIQVEIPRAVMRLATFGFRNSSKRTKRGRKFATVNPFTIPTDL
jgi:hypothetical protein